MRRFVPIFLIVAICMVVFGVRRHRTVLRQGHFVQMPKHTADESTDVAATLRELSSESSDEAVKGWATRFAAFVNDHPGRQFVVGRCERPCLSESEAAEQARLDSARKLYPIVARSLGDTKLSDELLLRNLVNQEVRSARLESDRFAEQFTRPYGKVWTESVLLDVSSDKLKPVVERYQQRVQMERMQSRRHTAATGAIIIATMLIALFLNVITKGYFTMRLQVAAAVIVAAALILLV